MDVILRFWHLYIQLPKTQTKKVIHTFNHYTLHLLFYLYNSSRQYLYNSWTQVRYKGNTNPSARLSGLRSWPNFPGLWRCLTFPKQSSTSQAELGKEFPATQCVCFLWFLIILCALLLSKEARETSSILVAHIMLTRSHLFFL